MAFDCAFEHPRLYSLYNCVTSVKYIQQTISTHRMDAITIENNAKGNVIRLSQLIILTRDNLFLFYPPAVLFDDDDDDDDDLCCLTPLSAKFQLYHDDQF